MSYEYIREYCYDAVLDRFLDCAQASPYELRLCCTVIQARWDFQNCMQQKLTQEIQIFSVCGYLEAAVLLCAANITSIVYFLFNFFIFLCGRTPHCKYPSFGRDSASHCLGKLIEQFRIVQCMAAQLPSHGVDRIKHVNLT